MDGQFLLKSDITPQQPGGAGTQAPADPLALLPGVDYQVDALRRLAPARVHAV
jgi:hypothetical protein